MLYNSCNGGTGAITSTGKEVFVKFTSDGALTTGFKIDYKTVEKQSNGEYDKYIEISKTYAVFLYYVTIICMNSIKIDAQSRCTV